MYFDWKTSNCSTLILIEVFPLTDLDIPRCSDQAGGAKPAERLSPEHLALLRNPSLDLELERNQTAQPDEVQGGDEAMDSGKFISKSSTRPLIGPYIEDEWIENFFNEVNQTVGLKKKQSRSKTFLI